MVVVHMHDVAYVVEIEIVVDIAGVDIVDIVVVDIVVVDTVVVTVVVETVVVVIAADANAETEPVVIVEAA